MKTVPLSCCLEQLVGLNPSTRKLFSDPCHKAAYKTAAIDRDQWVYTEVGPQQIGMHLVSGSLALFYPDTVFTEVGSITRF